MHDRYIIYQELHSIITTVTPLSEIVVHNIKCFVLEALIAKAGGFVLYCANYARFGWVIKKQQANNIFVSSYKLVSITI
jgi:hypothetical protein